MTNYSTFSNFLKNNEKDRLQLTFSEIEKILGSKLTPTSYKYAAWWSNSPTHPLMKEVLENGWISQGLNLKKKHIIFLKGNKRHKAANKKIAKSIKPITITEDTKSKFFKLDSPTHVFSDSNFYFEFVQQIIPELDENNNPKEFMPQSQYENKKNLSLNLHGKGPFCKFSIPKKYQKKSGVYLLQLNKRVKYVGECVDFYQRYNLGYGRIDPRNCFEGGQSTNCRINSLILKEYKMGSTIELFFHETHDRFRVEHDLIKKHHPVWNKTIGNPSLTRR